MLWRSGRGSRHVNVTGEARRWTRGGWGSAATIDAAGAAPLAREPVSVPPRCLQCMLQSSEGIWRSPEAVRRARGAAFEPEARQLAIALSPRERKTTAKALGAAHYASKTVLCFVQTRLRALLRPFWSVLTAKPAEPILPPPSKNGRRNSQRMRRQALWALRESSGPKIPAFEPGLARRTGATSSIPL